MYWYTYEWICILCAVVPIESDADDSNTNGMEIIVWFLGVCAFCALGALLLIVCWRKFSKNDKNENENAINLEFLLDPNAPMDPNSNLFASPMHIDEDDEENHTIQPYLDMDIEADLRPKKSKKQKKFNRLSLDEDEVENTENEANDNENNILLDSDEFEDEQDDDNNDDGLEDYEPPNLMNGRL